MLNFDEPIVYQSITSVLRTICTRPLFKFKHILYMFFILHVFPTNIIGSASVLVKFIAQNVLGSSIDDEFDLCKYITAL